MSQSPSINPNRQFSFLQSSSTPLFLQNSSPHRFKSTSLKQINHSKLRNQSSPYYINNQQQLQDRQINPANILFNYQHCDDSESDITSTSQDTSISSFTKTNPPTTPISSLIPTSTESSPSLITKTEILYVTPASNSLESSRPISSDVTSYSRSSSYTSLNSFEIKSTHSSLQSDYSNQPNSANFTDLPNSPSAQSPTVLNNFIQNYSMDSNPSKSNDITVMEKTVLANCSRSNYEIEDEQVISYDMEGSISGRSNVSQLTFPNEPTADLAFIRNLLDTKKNQKNEWSNLYTPPVKLDSSSIQQKNLDMLQVSKSLFPDFRNDFFTVTSSDSDMDKDSIKFYNDEEDRESCTSKASVPSIIRNDMENNLLNKIHLNVLYDKLNSTKDSSLLERTQVNEMSQVEEQEEEEEDDQKILFEFIDECFKNNKNLNDDNEDDKLPKINEEEEENENECSFVEKIKINKKPVPIVQMTKTAMLRANKLKEMSQAKGLVNQSSVKKSLPQVCKTNTISNKPNFKFINSTSGSSHLNNNKKTSQVLTSINNNWHSK